MLMYALKQNRPLFLWSCQSPVISSEPGAFVSSSHQTSPVTQFLENIHWQIPWKKDRWCFLHVHILNMYSHCTSAYMIKGIINKVEFFIYVCLWSTCFRVDWYLSSFTYGNIILKSLKVFQAYFTFYLYLLYVCSMHSYLVIKWDILQTAYSNTKKGILDMIWSY